ncbi:two-component system, response regulator YesN [Paenibacillus sp. 1_12]|uniref:response regulator n=1 Tax=Paenibacillus sp. 1_12 TaxID=1566278 RepID=UPI0008E9552C|nr:response regulator [Paenibacillus sp. 1_12]SFK66757.1 two-component system, response regulator YesN [Paenibacillus sp. 1_12]
MIKVMIADDEILARVGLKTLIPWEKFDFDLIAEAENGKVALDLAMQLKPDIIITDIKMPILNGVELIAALREHLKDTKFIVLSSYGDFDYVKEAMRIGAEDYILKLEMEPDLFIALLNKVKGKIEAERSMYKEQVKDELYKRRNLSALRDKLFQDLFFSYYVNEEEIKGQCDYLEIKLHSSKLVCLILRVENRELFEKYGVDDRYILTYGITNIIEEILQNYPHAYVISTNSMEFTIVFSVESDSEREVKSVAEKIAKHVENALKTYLNFKCSIGISEVCSHFRKLKTAYRQASEALNQGFSELKQTIHHFQQTFDSSHTIGFEEEFKNIEKAFHVLDGGLITNAFDQFVQKIDDGRFNKSEDTLRGICWSLTFMVTVRCKEFTEEDLDKTVPLSRLEQFRTLDDFRNWILELKAKVISVLLQIDDAKNIVFRAKKIILENYDKDISLKSVSNCLNITPNYLSSLFKRGTNENFIDFLIQVRIEQAQHLLKHSNSKVYEIGVRVGYPDAYYFSKIFKRVIGQTPQEYRNHQK